LSLYAEFDELLLSTEDQRSALWNERRMKLRIRIWSGPRFELEVDTALTVRHSYSIMSPLLKLAHAYLPELLVAHLGWSPQIGELKMKIQESNSKLAADCHEIVYLYEALSNDATIASTGVTEDEAFLITSICEYQVRSDAFYVYEGDGPSRGYSCM
jgi:hypothetical protein